MMPLLTLLLLLLLQSASVTTLPGGGAHQEGERGTQREGDRGTQREGDRGTQREGDRGTQREGERGTQREGDRGTQREGDRGTQRGDGRLLEAPDVLIDAINAYNNQEPTYNVPKEEDRGEGAGRRWMGRANEELRGWKQRLSSLEWKFVTNITRYNQDTELEVGKQYQKWFKSTLTEGRKFPFHQFRSRDLRRQFQVFTQSTETSDPRKSAEIDKLQSSMAASYDVSRVCLGRVAEHQRRREDSVNSRNSSSSRHVSKDSLSNHHNEDSFRSQDIVVIEGSSSSHAKEDSSRIRYANEDSSSRQAKEGSSRIRYANKDSSSRRASEVDSSSGNHGNGNRAREEECLSMEPGLQDVMAQSRDPERLLRAWWGWRQEAGAPLRPSYRRMVALLNDGAVENGYADYGQGWRDEQFPDHTDVIKMAAGLWRELRPLYLQLHAYTRRRLRQRYGSEVVDKDGAIPAHLLGNMWGQQWHNIYPLLTPYPEDASSSAQSRDSSLDHALKERYDVTGMFRLAEQFFASLGLPNMTSTFWVRSMLRKPEDRKVQCHASALDMFSSGDFRIKMCTQVSLPYLRTIHHEMGHVHYFSAYAQQPTVFRDGANCAFHEAIGDTVALSALSRTHMEKLGLYARSTGLSQHEEDMNDLMKTALLKIAFLPFGLLVDQWRWQVFSGNTTASTYNRDWWKLRLDLQGIRSPVPRSEDDFDPAAKFHVAANSPYICYFVSHVLQFQLYQALCDVSGYVGPLHLCDFGGSPAAGAVLRRLMAAGSSRPWQEVLLEVTGSRKMSAQPILDYFRPLHDWLRADNSRHSQRLGWKGATINWRKG